LAAEQPGFVVRAASAGDGEFLREMARHAATLEDRPLPDIDALEVAALLPAEAQDALVVVAGSGRRLGAAWWMTGGVPLVPELPSAPEACVALVPDARHRGLGTALLEALVGRAEARGHPALVLNVHPRNAAAIHLYMRCGFRVAGSGRGWFGVAMSRRTSREEVRPPPGP